MAQSEHALGAFGPEADWRRHASWHCCLASWSLAFCDPFRHVSLAGLCLSILCLISFDLARSRLILIGYCLALRSASRNFANLQKSVRKALLKSPWKVSKSITNGFLEWSTEVWKQVAPGPPKSVRIGCCLKPFDATWVVWGATLSSLGVRCSPKGAKIDSNICHKSKGLSTSFTSWYHISQAEREIAFGERI